MSIVQKLNAVIDDRYIHSYSESGNEYTILTENQKDSTCKDITLRHQAMQRVLVLNIDLQSATENIHPFFVEKEKENQTGTFAGLRKKVDYLIFCERKSKTNLGELETFVFAVELKSKSTTGWHRQVKAGHTFAQYLISFLHIRDGASLELKKNKVIYRCILFNSKASAEGANSYEKKGKNSQRRKFAQRQKDKKIYELYDEFDHQYCIRQCGNTYQLKTFAC